jgi:outer membrane assembly lipoprotein YfiO
MKRRPTNICLVLLLLWTVACGSGRRDDPILRLASGEALQQGKELMAQGNFREARKYLIHAFEIAPNSADGREGLLLAADALFQQGGFDSYVEAEARYRDFLNRFPTSDRADHAQFRMAQALSRRTEKPNREQETTTKALAAVEDFMRVYPTSPLFSEAEALREELRNQQAEHEWIVARFYSRFGLSGATIERLDYLRENFPSYPEMEMVQELGCRIFYRAQEHAEKAVKVAEWCGALARDYPENPLLGNIPPEALVPPPAAESPEPVAEEEQ